jgi:hypothetical protein
MSEELNERDDEQYKTNKEEVENNKLFREDIEDEKGEMIYMKENIELFDDRNGLM